MTVWNDEERSEQLAHATWMASTAVLMHLNERATGDPARDWLSSWAHRWFVGRDLRVLVLGCGEGWLERAVAQWPFVARIDAVDFAEHAVARAREAARGIGKIRYGVVDLNGDELPAGAYDVVVAHSVLHHVDDLEHAYAQIERAMRPDATLILNEYAGPRRFQFSDDVLAIINALLACIGFPPKVRPSVDEMIANDPTEAVRSDELLAFTSRTFEIVERKEIGGTILQHLLYEVVRHFRFEVPRERAILEILCTIEAMLVDSGRVPCDYVILAARKKGSRVRRASRPLPPRAEAARDVEGDPLWASRSAPRSAGSRSAGSRSAGFQPAAPPASSRRRQDAGDPAAWKAALRNAALRNLSLRKAALRCFRLALLSQQPHRANLHRESLLLELRERWRARHTTLWQHVLASAPPDEAIRCLLRTAATLAGE